MSKPKGYQKGVKDSWIEKAALALGRRRKDGSRAGSPSQIQRKNVKMFSRTIVKKKNQGQVIIIIMQKRSNRQMWNRKYSGTSLKGIRQEQKSVSKIVFLYWIYGNFSRWEGRGRCYILAQCPCSRDKMRQCSIRYVVQNEVAAHINAWLARCRKHFFKTSYFAGLEQITGDPSKVLLTKKFEEVNNILSKMIKSICA